MLQILSKSKYIQILKPMGSFYALPSIQKLIGKSTPDGKLIKSDSDFVLELLSRFGVAVVPGSAFGARDTFRISYAAPEALIQEGCYLILNFADSLK